MLTRDDAATVRALASLARFVPESKRADHLIGQAESVAAKIIAEVELREQVVAAFAEPVGVR